MSYIYIYMYKYIYISYNMYIYIYIHIHIYSHVCLYVYMFASPMEAIPATPKRRRRPKGGSCRELTLINVRSGGKVSPQTKNR